MEGEQNPSSTTPLKLAAPEGADVARGTTGWLARRFGVSPQAIRNWHDDGKGMPSCGVDERWGGPLFDLEECTKWRAANRPARMHGGKRPNSGKKPEKSPAELVPALAQAETKAERVARAGELLGELGKAAEAERAEGRRIDLASGGLLRMTEEELRTLVWLSPEVTGLNRTMIDWLVDLAKTQKSQMDMAERRGELHDAAECDAARTQHLTLLRTKLMGLPGRAAAQVVAAARLGPELVPVVKEALRAAVDEVMREIAGDPMGAAA